MTTSSPDTSGEWRRLGPEEVETIRTAVQRGDLWPKSVAADLLPRLLANLDAATQRAEKAEAALHKIIAAYEATNLEHDTYYEDFVEVIVAVRYERWLRERDARAALAEETP